MNFMAPIPGMSLTQEPGNAPYEQPPLYDLPEQVLGFYIEKFNDEDKLDDILFGLESGVPLDFLVDSMTSIGVMEGYHSFDVKVLVMPILHEYLLTLAKAADIDVVEESGPTKETKKKEKDKQRLQILLEKALDNPDLESAVVGPEGLTPEVDEPLIKRRS
jgi:hypothetical protein